MSIIINIYIFVCIMLFLFNVVFLITKNFKNRKFYAKSDKFRGMLQEELGKYDPKLGLSDKLKDFLVNKISRTKKLIVLQDELQNIEKYKEEIQAEIRPYIFNEIESYKEKSDYEQAYYAYAVSLYDHGKDDHDEMFYPKFLSFLDSKSLYTFSNAMDTLYKLSDPYLMSQAVNKVDEKEGFYNSKLFIDGLLKFDGDTETFHSLIIDKFYKYKPLTQVSLLKYFTLRGAKVDELCLDILKNRNVDEEVIYSAIRYFRKYPNEQAKNMLINILQNNESLWVEQLIAIKALNPYGETLVRNIIEEKVTSRNWHVRVNAIRYLHDNILSRDDIYKILSLGDKYTNESLLYYYRDDEEISKYIIETMEIIDEKEAKAEALTLEEIEAETEIGAETEEDESLAKDSHSV